MKPLPVYVESVEEFARWLVTSGDTPQLKRMGERIGILANAAEDHRQLCADLRVAVARVDLFSGPHSMDSLQDGLASVMDRYEHVRASLNEWHDVDISAEDYRDTVSAMSRKASDDDDFRYKVRQAIIAQGAATNADDDDAYMLAVLGALIG